MNLGTRLVLYIPVNSARDSQVSKSKATNKQTVQQGQRVQSAMFKAKILVVGPCEVSEEQE